MNRYQLISWKYKVFVEFEVSPEGREEAKKVRTKCPMLFKNLKIEEVLQLYPDDVECGVFYKFGKEDK